MAKTLTNMYYQTLIFLISAVLISAQNETTQFIYNGFTTGAKLHLDGLANINSNGLLQLTNFSKQQTGHAFYPKPLNFTKTLSFSTTFIFAMYPDVPDHSGHGLAFVISSSLNFSQAVPAEYLGLFSLTNNGFNSNHIFAVELDTVQNAVFGDIDGNHVGIDVNGLKSVDSATAAYFSDDENINKTLKLTSTKPMQVWIDYNAEETLINVTLTPFRHSKPTKSLLSTHLNLSSVFQKSMYVGFSAATGLTANQHYILGWSLSQLGQAQALDTSKLPKLPKIDDHKGGLNPLFIVLLVVLLIVLVLIGVLAYYIWRKMFKELKEPWEREYASHRLCYKDLYMSTKGFRDSELLGSGGFGKVYKGMLPLNQSQIAVKRISHDSRQGMREFVSEIVSMRRLRHRNLVQLLGYCRRKGELLLVYDYMPNGSLDKVLFGNNNGKSKPSWPQRFNIIKGVASALLYLHEEWEQLVLHRDVKASNVLLDGDMNARLGDFGLARLYDHDTNPRSTHVVGTVGYLAPELSVTGKPTTSTDVFAFGTFLLEVACGRRPIDLHNVDTEDVILVDWVLDCWKRGSICETSDPKLEGNYVSQEMEMVLKLGLHCSHPKPEARPSMRQAVQFLRGDAALPDIPADYDLERGDLLDESWGTSASRMSSSFDVSAGTFFRDNSVVDHGR